MGPPQKMTHGARFRRGGAGCGWKGISIALTIRSLDRTYRMGCDRDFSPPNAGLVKGLATENPTNTRRIPLT